MKQAVEDFWLKVDKDGPISIYDGEKCWLWTRAVRRDGYGICSFGGKINLAVHRLSWVFVNGEIPDGLWVLHRCDVKLCVNPKHLFLGTRQDNMDDMVAKGRAAHLDGELSGNSKLTDGKVSEIYRLAMLGTMHKDIAVVVGVSKGNVSAILRGEAWTHVKPPEGYKSLRRHDNRRAKLTEDDAREIRRLRTGGMKFRDIKLLFPVAHARLVDVVNRKAFKYVE